MAGARLSIGQPLLTFSLCGAHFMDLVDARRSLDRCATGPGYDDSACTDVTTRWQTHHAFQSVGTAPLQDCTYSTSSKLLLLFVSS